MADKEKRQAKHESLLVEAAKKIGEIAGGIAETVGLGGNHPAGDHPQQAAAPEPGRKGKLRKKHKNRLPRRVKKEMKKKQAAIQA